MPRSSLKWRYGTIDISCAVLLVVSIAHGAGMSTRVIGEMCSQLHAVRRSKKQ
jgi:hypothetical protein